jgi:excisionase family DNA binding protein
MARRTAGKTAAAADPVAGEKLTVNEVCAELKVSRSTFYSWRQAGKGPRAIKLPNGDVRVLRADLDAWLRARREEAA